MPINRKVRFKAGREQDAFRVGSLLAQLLQTSVEMEPEPVDGETVLWITVPARWADLIPFLFDHRRLENADR